MVKRLFLLFLLFMFFLPGHVSSAISVDDFDYYWLTGNSIKTNLFRGTLTKSEENPESAILQAIKANANWAGCLNTSQDGLSEKCWFFDSNINTSDSQYYTSTLHIIVNLRSPQKGLRINTIAASRAPQPLPATTEEISIPDPLDNAPEPLQIIDRGKLGGIIYGPSDSTNDFSSIVKKGGVILEKRENGTYVSPTEIEKANVSGISDGIGWVIDLTSVPGGVTPGEYRASYIYEGGADCESKELDGTDILAFTNIFSSLAETYQNLSREVQNCSIKFVGESYFTLSYFNDGIGLVTLSDNDGTNEKYFESAGQNITERNTTVIEPSSGVGIDIDVNEVFSKEDLFSGALKNAAVELLKMINFGIETGGNWINSILTEGNDMEETLGVKDVWRSVRNITLGLLTLAILIISFANILNINLANYGLARILPKMIIAIVLAYFSYLIAIFLLDMMSAFQSLLFSAAGSTSSASSLALTSTAQSFVTPDVVDRITVIPELIFLAILGIFLFLATLWLCLILIVRSAMLFLIIAVAPLAFLSNIFPFTESYYKKWWAAFWKWAFMGPAVAFMLWMSQEFLVDGYLTSKFAEADPNTSASWVFLIGAAVMTFLSATIPLKMGGDIYGKIGVDKLPKKGLDFAWQKSGGKSYMDARKASIAARDKARGDKLRASLALSGKGQDSWLRRRAAGIDKQQAAALKLQTIKSMGDTLPEDAAALKDIIEGTKGLRQEAAIFKAASSGKLTALDKDENGNVTGISKSVGIVERLVAENAIPELDRVISKEQGDFFTTAALNMTAEQEAVYGKTIGSAKARIAKTKYDEYKPDDWKFVAKNGYTVGKDSNGQDIVKSFQEAIKDTSFVDAAMKGKQESRIAFAQQIVQGGGLSSLTNIDQIKNVGVAGGATQQQIDAAVAAVSGPQNPPGNQNTPPGVNGNNYTQGPGGLWTPRQ